MNKFDLEILLGCDYSTLFEIKETLKDLILGTEERLKQDINNSLLVCDLDLYQTNMNTLLMAIDSKESDILLDVGYSVFCLN